MSILKIKNEQNQWIQLPVLKGPKGDSYILTEEDKQEIAELVQPSVKDVQINHNSVTTDGIANIFNTNGLYGVIVNNNGYIAIQGATEGYIKAGKSYGEPILPSYQHQSTFYGLAKVAGHDEKDSTLPLGQYTDEAKSKIQTMLGIDILIAGPETDPFTSSHSIGDVFIINSKLYKALTVLNAGEYINEDVNVTGVNIIELLEEDYVKKTDIATNNKLGIVKGKYESGTQVLADGSLITAPALQDEIKAGTAVYKPVTPKTQHESVFYGLAKAAGDTTQGQSDNTVGLYTDEAKIAIRAMLGVDTTSILQEVENGFPIAEEVSF